MTQIMQEIEAPWETRYVEGEGLYVYDANGQRVCYARGSATRSYLIAAAPKLLQAARQALAELVAGQSEDTATDVKRFLREAIAEAERKER